MTETNLLKLAAIDEEDLAIVSTFVQDAVLKVGDMVYLPKQSRFALAVNRFGWEAAGERSKTYQRRRTALVFDRVRAVRTSQIDRERPDEILELLAVRYLPAEAPEGTIDLCFAGGGGVQLDVECIETRLTDLGAAWSTEHKPWHAVNDAPDG